MGDDYEILDPNRTGEKITEEAPSTPIMSSIKQPVVADDKPNDKKLKSEKKKRKTKSKKDAKLEQKKEKAKTGDKVNDK